MINLEDVTLDCKFIPFSQSRHKDQPYKSMNWRVTLKYKGHEVLTTDYGKGVGHCKSYQNPPRFKSGKIDHYIQRQLIEMEVEKGVIPRRGFGDTVYPSRVKVPEPTKEEVLAALTSDSEVLQFSSFQDWAHEFGYNPDSIKDKALYDDCLSIALKMNSVFNLDELRQQFEDY